MKIVILGDNSSVHFQKWISAIVNFQEIDLHIISFDKGMKYNNVSYYSMNRITGTKIDFFLNAIKVKSLIKQINPDLVHAHYATSYGFLARFSNFHPYIITGWGSDIFDSPKSFFMKKMVMKTFEKADSISVLSKITLNEMKKLTNKFVHLIPFGVDIQKFTPRLNKSDEIIRIGTIRTLSEKYGVEYLIRAFAKLVPNNENIQLEIVGDGPLKAYFEELVVELKIKDKVIFYGYVNQNSNFNEYIKILSNFDVFAILSILDSETVGVAAVEASACQIPVVATSVGGLPEVVEAELTGILVSPKNVDETATALNRLINDENLRFEMGKRGRKKVEENYNWANNIEQMVNLYKDTIQKFNSKIN